MGEDPAAYVHAEVQAKKDAARSALNLRAFNEDILADVLQKRLLPDLLKMSAALAMIGLAR